MTPGPLAIDLDQVIGDTHSLWLAWLEGAGPLLGIDAAGLPPDRGEAALELDRHGAGNWRTLLERFVEDRAAVHLRRDPSVSAALRALASSGHVLGVFTDAPEPLARVALAHLGADRSVSALETGSGALVRLLERLGNDAAIVRSPDELAELAALPAS